MAPAFAILASVALILTAATSCSCSGQGDDIPKFTALRRCLLRKGVPKFRIVPRDDSSGFMGRRYAQLNYQGAPQPILPRIAPLAYLNASRVSHVQAAVRCCRREGVRIVPRSGAHSYAKYSFGGPLSLVVQIRMNRVRIDHSDATVAVDSGALGGRVQYKLWRAGDAGGSLVVPVPDCQTVAMAGFTLGGGHSSISRLLGTASDNVLEIRMVDATGARRVVNSESDPDLFWALRGGAGGNFGIVTSFTFKASPAPKSVDFASVWYEIGDFSAFFKSWQAYIVNSSYTGENDRVSTQIGFNWPKKFVMEMWIVRGEGGGDGGAEMGQILSTWFPVPQSWTWSTMSYPEFILRVAQDYTRVPLTTPAQLAQLTRHQDTGWKVVKSMYVQQIIDREGDMANLDGLMRQMLNSGAKASFEQHGGAIGHPAPGDTAYVHRRALYLVQLRNNITGGVEAHPNVVQAQEAMRHFYEATKSPALFAHKESYQNYHDADLSRSEALRRYYGSNLKRLVAVKRRVDPDNMFRFPQSIPTRLVKNKLKN